MSPETRWYKGNLHMHSYWSDGRGFPEMIVRWFKANDYHFIAFTEHNQLQSGQCWIATNADSHPVKPLPQGSLLAQYLAAFGEDWVDQRDTEQGHEVRLMPLYEYRHLYEEAERFLILTGEEIDSDTPERRHWINVINLAEAIAPQPKEPSTPAAMAATLRVAEEAAKASGRPLLTYLNHPNYLWNATAEEIAATEGLRFVEIHTALNSTKTYGEGDYVGAERIWDIALSLRLSQPKAEILYGVANDDCHGYPDEIPQPQGNHPGRAWMMVRASRLTPEKIINAILQGDYYCSTGVTFSELEYTDDSLYLTIEPEANVSYFTRFIGTLRNADLSATPIVDDTGEPIHATHQYSVQVGMVLAEVGGLEASYQLRGDELYVRAVVISDQPHPNPTVPGDVMKAWTQPLGHSRLYPDASSHAMAVHKQSKSLSPL